MPPKRKVETVEDKTKAPPAKKTSEEETPTISPDKGATGETATSSKTMDIFMLLHTLQMCILVQFKLLRG